MCLGLAHAFDRRGHHHSSAGRSAAIGGVVGVNVGSANYVVDRASRLFSPQSVDVAS
jgi:hypothetical protein